MGTRRLRAKPQTFEGLTGMHNSARESERLRKPQVSVIVAAYNADTTLEGAVRSALDQKGISLEVIIIDDASTDNTLAVAQSLAADPRVIAVPCPRNIGISRARNTGLDVASGTWVAPLDADDFFSPGRLMAMVASAESLRADLIADNIMLRDVGSESLGELFSRDFCVEQPIKLQEYVRKSEPPGESSFGYSKPLIRRSFLEENRLRYPIEVEICEDWLLYLICLIKGASFFRIPESYYNYVVHAKSISRNNSRMLTNTRQLIEAYRIGRGLLLEAGEKKLSDDMRGYINSFELILMKQRFKKPFLDFPPTRAIIYSVKKHLIQDSALHT